jgi:hypothetical protein
MRSFDAGDLDDPDSCDLAFMRLIGFLVWPADEVAANQFVAKMMAFPIDEFIARIREAQRANQRDAESLLREERDRFEQRCLEPFGRVSRRNDASHVIGLHDEKGPIWESDRGAHAAAACGW